jgi:single-strand DNA-binding protein
MNTVTLIGNLTKDPEMAGGGETKVCRMRLAESAGAGSEPLYIDVAAFGRQAETCQRYLRKGRAVAVSGRLRFRQWQGRDGTRRSAHSIAADRVDFLSGAGKERSESGAQEGDPAVEAPEEAPVF